MVRCPGCGAALPNGAVACQFCGHGLGPPAVRLGRPAPQRAPDAAVGAPGWVKPVYNLIAAYWVLSGAWGVLSATVLAGKDGPNGVAAAFALIPVVVGAGLLARVEFVRGLVNFLCALQILSGLFGVVMAFLMGSPLGLLLNIVQVFTAGFMIFQIGETDASGPRW